jgi:hypothetical protein
MRRGEKMKKPSVVIYPDIWRTFQWFRWRTCERCREDFRREWGWRYLTGPYHGGIGVEKFLCFSCGGPTPQTATKCIEWLNAERKNAKPAGVPSPPPPPPSRFKREW